MTLKEDFNELKRKSREVETSFTIEILKDYKKANKRQFIIIIVLILCLMGSIGYTFYILNDIQTVTTTDTIDIQDVNDINDSEIGIGR